MCLKYGTPYRLYKALTTEATYPDHCEDHETLRGLLMAEFENGCYDNPEVFTPALRELLWVLVYRYHMVDAQRCEPYYPYCDMIQGLAFTFGIFRTMSKWYPVEIQDHIAMHGLGPKSDGVPIIASTCYTSARALWRAMDKTFQDQTAGLYAQWEKLGGFVNTLSELAFTDPHLLAVTPYREVRGSY